MAYSTPLVQAQESHPWRRSPSASAHGFGGNPSQRVCCRAKCQPGRAIVTRRDPSDLPRHFAPDVDNAPERPASESPAWNASAACETTPVPRRLDAGRAASVPPAPLQGFAWELAPAR